MKKKLCTKSILARSILALAGAMSVVPLAQAADVFLNTRLVSHFNPVPGYKMFSDVWGEGNLVTLGTYTNGSEGVFVIDITDPSFPVLTSHYKSSATDFRDVKLRNGIGYFSNAANLGVELVDLSIPSAPVLISQIATAENGLDTPHNIFLDGDYLYEVSGHDEFVRVFNIANSAAPFFVRDIPIDISGNNTHDITVVNNLLYLSNYGVFTFTGDVFDGTTEIIDVTNVGDPINFPTLPLVSTFDSGPGTHNNWATADGNTMAVGREIPSGGTTLEGDIRIYDNSQVSPTTPPTLRSTITAETLGIDASTPHNVIISGDRAFVSWYQAGLQVLDISDPAAPEHVGSYDTFPGSCDGDRKSCADYAGAWGVYPFLGADRVLVSDMNNGLFIVDASRATSACEGDLDNNGSVDSLDEAILNAEIGRTNCSRRNPCIADVDADGDVDNADAIIIGQDTGRTDCPIENTNALPIVAISSPLPTSPAPLERDINVSTSFTATASDEEDGALTNSITWESNLDGIIGTGGNVSAVLTPGIHTVRASVTDSASELGSDFAVVIVTDLIIPLELEATGYTTKGKNKLNKVDLSWTAGTGSVDIYRDNVIIFTTVNDGTSIYTEDLGNTTSATYNYQVCEAGVTTNCSNTVQVVF